ncbi:MAG: hypothetical protein H6757_05715 [Candidatus Omnitrophica bacterium]|nr:hypothetical protein [Candidatus Omnitrophota bacterium]
MKFISKFLKKVIASMITVTMCLQANTAYGLPETSSGASSLSFENPFSLFDVTVPEAIGRIKEKFEGPDRNGETLFIIQDAHAIPDAQRSIQKLIEHTQSAYGVRLVGLEGAASDLDAGIFKSFPDKDVLKKVFSDYFDCGEVSGGTAAAIFSDSPAVYHGIEDWELYKQGLRFFLAAANKEKEIEPRLNQLSQEIETEKTEIYSKELLAIDRALQSFGDNDSDLMSVLQKLAAVKAPKQGSQLALLVEEAGRAKASEPSIETEVEEIADTVRHALTEMDPSEEVRAEEAELNREFQSFQTSQITPQAFALFLKGLVFKYKIRVKASKQLRDQVGNQKRLRDIEGTQLFDDFETYARKVKESLFQNDEERNLDRRSEVLGLVKHLAKLELGRSDWAKLKAVMTRMETLDMAEDGIDRRSDIAKLLERMQPHLDFYTNSEKRDRALIKNMRALLEKNKTKSAVLVAGGFHAEGLTYELKAKGISYVLMMPAIKNIPDKTNYRAHMNGEVSWADYLKVEDGKVDLHAAFLRGTRDRLIREAYLVKGISQSGVRDTNDASRFMLKQWRDQIIRDLADTERITKAGSMTRYLDEVLGKNSRQASAETVELIKKWQAHVDRFLNGLRGLHEPGQLTDANILKLLAPQTTPAILTGPEAALLDKPELRVGVDLIPALNNLKMKNKRGSPLEGRAKLDSGQQPLSGLPDGQAEKSELRENLFQGGKAASSKRLSPLELLRIAESIAETEFEYKIAGYFSTKVSASKDKALVDTHLARVKRSLLDRGLHPDDVALVRRDLYVKKYKANPADKDFYYTVALRGNLEKLIPDIARNEPLNRYYEAKESIIDGYLRKGFIHLKDLKEIVVREMVSEQMVESKGEGRRLFDAQFEEVKQHGFDARRFAKGWGDRWEDHFMIWRLVASFTELIKQHETKGYHPVYIARGAAAIFTIKDALERLGENKKGAIGTVYHMNSTQINPGGFLFDRAKKIGEKLSESVHDDSERNREVVRQLISEIEKNKDRKFRQWLSTRMTEIEEMGILRHPKVLWVEEGVEGTVPLILEAITAYMTKDRKEKPVQQTLLFYGNDNVHQVFYPSRIENEKERAIARTLFGNYYNRLKINPNDTFDPPVMELRPDVLEQKEDGSALRTTNTAQQVQALIFRYYFLFNAARAKFEGTANLPPDFSELANEQEGGQTGKPELRELDDRYSASDSAVRKARQKGDGREQIHTLLVEAGNQVANIKKFPQEYPVKREAEERINHFLAELEKLKEVLQGDEPVRSSAYWHYLSQTLGGFIENLNHLIEENHPASDKRKGGASRFLLLAVEKLREAQIESSVLGSSALSLPEAAGKSEMRPVTDVAGLHKPFDSLDRTEMRSSTLLPIAEIQSRMAEGKKNGDVLIGFLRDENQKLQPIFSDKPSIRNKRDVMAMGALFTSSKNAGIIPLEVQDVEMTKFTKTTDWENLPDNLEEFKSLFNGNQILVTSSRQDRSPFSILMLYTPAQTVSDGWGGSESILNEGRTGVLLKDGLPIIVVIDGKEFLIEIKGVGNPDGGYDYNYKVLRGGVQLPEADREEYSLGVKRKLDKRFDDGISVRGLANIHFRLNGRQEQGYILRLAPGSIRSSYEKYPSFPIDTFKEENDYDAKDWKKIIPDREKRKRLIEKMAHAMGKETGELMSVGMIPISHPENLIVLDQWSDFTFTDGSDIFPIESFPADIEGHYTLLDEAVDMAMAAPSQIHHSRRHPSDEYFIEGLAEGLFEGNKITAEQREILVGLSSGKAVREFLLNTFLNHDYQQRRAAGGFDTPPTEPGGADSDHSELRTNADALARHKPSGSLDRTEMRPVTDVAGLHKTFDSLDRTEMRTIQEMDWIDFDKITFQTLKRSVVGRMTEISRALGWVEDAVYEDRQWMQPSGKLIRALDETGRMIAFAEFAFDEGAKGIASLGEIGFPPEWVYSGEAAAFLRSVIHYLQNQGANTVETMLHLNQNDELVMFDSLITANRLKLSSFAIEKLDSSGRIQLSGEQLGNISLTESIAKLNEQYPGAIKTQEAFAYNETVFLILGPVDTDQEVLKIKRASRASLMTVYEKQAARYFEEGINQTLESVSEAFGIPEDDLKRVYYGTFTENSLNQLKQSYLRLLVLMLFYQEIFNENRDWMGFSAIEFTRESFESMNRNLMQDSNLSELAFAFDEVARLRGEAAAISDEISEFAANHSGKETFKEKVVQAMQVWTDEDPSLGDENTILQMPAPSELHHRLDQLGREVLAVEEKLYASTLELLDISKRQLAAGGEEKGNSPPGGQGKPDSDEQPPADRTEMRPVTDVTGLHKSFDSLDRTEMRPVTDVTGLHKSFDSLDRTEMRPVTDVTGLHKPFGSLDRTEMRTEATSAIAKLFALIANSDQPLKLAMIEFESDMDRRTVSRGVAYLRALRLIHYYPEFQGNAYALSASSKGHIDNIIELLNRLEKEVPASQEIRNIFPQVQEVSSPVSLPESKGSITVDVADSQFNQAYEAFERARALMREGYEVTLKNGERSYRLLRSFDRQPVFLVRIDWPDQGPQLRVIKAVEDYHQDDLRRNKELLMRMSADQDTPFVKFYHIDDEKGIVEMEMIQGEMLYELTLMQRLEGILTLIKSLSETYQKHGVFHRDVVPLNLRFLLRTRPVLIDLDDVAVPDPNIPPMEDLKTPVKYSDIALLGDLIFESYQAEIDEHVHAQADMTMLENLKNFDDRDVSDGTPVNIESYQTNIQPVDLTGVPEAVQKVILKARLSDETHYESFDEMAREFEAALRRSYPRYFRPELRTGIETVGASENISMDRTLTAVLEQTEDPEAAAFVRSEIARVGIDQFIEEFTAAFEAKVAAKLAAAQELGKIDEETAQKVQAFVNDLMQFLRESGLFGKQLMLAVHLLDGDNDVTVQGLVDALLQDDVLAHTERVIFSGRTQAIEDEQSRMREAHLAFTTRNDLDRIRAAQLYNQHVLPSIQKFAGGGTTNALLVQVGINAQETESWNPVYEIGESALQVVSALLIAGGLDSPEGMQASEIETRLAELLKSLPGNATELLEYHVRPDANGHLQISVNFKRSLFAGFIADYQAKAEIRKAA